MGSLCFKSKDEETPAPKPTVLTSQELASRTLSRDDFHKSMMKPSWDPKRWYEENF